jgi:hypothetical protein
VARKAKPPQTTKKKQQSPPQPRKQKSEKFWTPSMALAIHFDGLLLDGVVKNYADLARLGRVSRARITQIMNILNLPQRKQDEILFLNGSDAWRAGVMERDIRRITVSACWPL